MRDYTLYLPIPRCVLRVEFCQEAVLSQVDQALSESEDNWWSTALRKARKKLSLTPMVRIPRRVEGEE